jgi:hypothetical protein
VKIAFLDTETTGLEREDEVIELHVQIWDSEGAGLVEGAEFYRLWYPCNLPSAKAAEVNGFSYSKWQERGATMFTGDDVRAARVPRQAQARLVRRREHSIRRQHAREHDAPRTRAAPHVADVRQVDVQSMAVPLMVAGKLKSAALASLCSYFGVQNSQAHSAKGDCLATLQVFEKLVGLYWPALGVAA